MTARCTVCTHPGLDEINRLMVSGKSLRSILDHYTDLSIGALQRHRANHLPDILIAGHEAERITRADELLTDLQGMKEMALWFLNEARYSKDLRAAAPLISSACRVIELLAEARGQLDRKAEINIILNPEFIQFKQNVLSVVNDCPECKRKLLEALNNGN